MEAHWYKNIVLYTVDVKSFYDSDGDGIGDLRGLILKLDYLAELGITGIWLLPFFPSPLRDNGYDVTDYYSVDSRLGTIADFQRLVRKASEMGIQIVMDIVMNHTSDQHPWFLASRQDPHSLFRNYYVWTDLPPPADPLDKPAFPGTEHGIWRFDEVARAYYYHKFYHSQPDLFVGNPKVQEEIHKVLDFWMTMGVSGFRLDAAPVMIKKKGLEKTTPHNPHGILSEMRTFINSRKKGAVLLGEVDVDGPELIEYFGEGTGLHLIFNFLLSAYLMSALARESAETLIRGWRELPIIPDSGNWLNFLRNLDELNLHQLPNRERKIIYDILGPEEGMRIYDRGVRRRLAPMLEGNQKRIEMAMSLLFSLPGTPMLVYGDEIGMGENLELSERESVRTPMQWTGANSAGFSVAGPEKLYRPLVKDPSFHFSKLNVKDQMAEPTSLFNAMKKLIYARKMHPEIGYGKLAWVATNHESVLGHICHWKNDMLLAVHNLSSKDLSVTLDLKTVYAKLLKIEFGECELVSLENGNYLINIRGHGYAWFSVHYEKEY